MHYDVIVIGGGLLGCAAAYYLSRDGASVLVLEQGQLNAEASGQNAGSLHFQFEYRAIGYGDAVLEQFSRAMPLHLDAMERWSRLEEELGVDLEVVQDGGLMLAETAEQVERLREKFELERRLGLPAEWLTGDDARRMLPGLAHDVQAAVFCPGEGHANPRHVTVAYAAEAIARGATVMSETTVTAIRQSDGPGVRYEVETATGDRFRAETLLNAAGAWAGHVAALVHLHLPVVPVGLQMHATHQEPAALPYLIQHVGHRLSLKQVRDGNYLIGGGWPSRLHTVDGRFDLSFRPAMLYESVVGNIWTACQVLPALRDTKLLRAWTGVAGIAVDQAPLLGEAPGRPGFFVIGGGSAFTLGPTYAALVSELILTGRCSLPIDAYSPRRFAHLNFL